MKNVYWHIANIVMILVIMFSIVALLKGIVNPAIAYSNFDSDVINIVDGKIFAVVEGLTSLVVTATFNDFVANETVSVEVKSGMSSESAASAAKDAGLVDDDIEFNKYLCENGYDKKLRVGSFDIPSGSDFETISKYLCGIK